jgi:hypothetical protein
LQISLKSLQGRRSHRHDPLDPSLSPDLDKPFLDVQISDIKPRQLADPDSRRIEQFDDRPVPDALQVVGEIHLQQRQHLVCGQNGGYMPLPARHLNQLRGIVRHLPFPEQISVKRPERGHLPGDRRFFEPPLKSVPRNERISR